MKKFVYIFIFLLLVTALSVNGQHGIAFYHLRNATFQNTNYNPAYMPAGKVFIGLPAISGVNVFVSNKFSYNDLFVKESDGIKIDVDNAISELGFSNLISTNVHLSLFHFGIRTRSRYAFTLFVNERAEIDLTYPKKLMKWAWTGNGNFIGRKMNFASLGLSGNYFREYGLGMAYETENGRLSSGVRLKFYQGIINLSTPGNFDIDIQTENENFQLNVENKNAIVRSSGLAPLLSGDADIVGQLLGFGNKGFGIDFGVDYKLNRYYSVALSATDIGFISWKEGIENYEFQDSSFRYTGVDLRTSGDAIVETVEDSLLNVLVDDLDTTFQAYTAPMVGKITGSFIFSPFRGLDVITSASTRIIQYQPKMAYAVGLRGYLGPKLIASASITKLPQQFFNIGAALAVGAGPVQFYASADKVLGYSVPNMRWAEFRVGLNFVFGSRRQTESGPAGYNRAAGEDLTGTISESKGVVTSTFMGDRVRVKRSEGIYTIIKRQEPGFAGSITPYVINNDRKNRRIQSATGSVNTSEGLPPRNVSATGDVNTQAKFPRKIESATGSVDNRKTKKQAGIRSASGSVDTGSGQKKKIRSASGSAQTGGRKSVQVRSASGSVQTSTGKKKKIQSASGANRTSKKKTKIRSASGKNRSSYKKGRGS